MKWIRAYQAMGYEYASGFGLEGLGVCGGVTSRVFQSRVPEYPS